MPDKVLSQMATNIFAKLSFALAKGSGNQVCIVGRRIKTYTQKRKKNMLMANGWKAAGMTV